jgi:hypothetical protein
VYQFGILLGCRPDLVLGRNVPRGLLYIFLSFLLFLFLFSYFFHNYFILAPIWFKPKPKVFKYS